MPLQGPKLGQTHTSWKAWVLRKNADPPQEVALFDVPHRRVCLPFQPGVGEGLALAGDGWITLPLVWPVEAPVEVLPAVSFTVALPPDFEDPGPAWVRLFPVNQPQGQSRNPLRYPLERANGALRGMVPAGTWLGQVVFARWSPVPLGYLIATGGEVQLAISQPLTPASNLLLRLSVDRGIDPRLLGQGKLHLVPHGGMEELWCAFVGKTLEQLAPYSSLEVDGEAFVPALDPGEYLAVALFPGHPPFLAGPVTVPRKFGLAEAPLLVGWGRFRLQVPEVDLFLQVPHNRASVEVSWLPASREAGRCTLTLPLASTGDALSPWLPYGAYRLRLVVWATKGYGTAVAETESRLRLPEEQALGFDLGPMIRGRVFSQGRPAICAVELSLLPEGKNPRSLLGWSGRDGRFLLLRGEAGEGSVSLRCLQPSLAAVIPWVSVRPAEELRLEVPTARIEGVLLDRQGFPIAGKINATWLGARDEDRVQAPIGLPNRVVTTQSKGDGRFALEHLVAGRWLLEAQRPGKGKALAKLTLAEGETVANVVLREQSEPLQVWLVHEDGSPVRGARAAVLAATKDLGQGLPFLVAQLSSDIHGVLELPWSAEEVQELHLDGATEEGSVFCSRITQLEETVRVLVPRTWGEVEIRLGEALSWGAFPRLTFLAGGGCWCEPFLWWHHRMGTLHWVPQEGRLRLRLSPGTYLLSRRTGGPMGRCDSPPQGAQQPQDVVFSLQAGQSLTVQLP